MDDYEIDLRRSTDEIANDSDYHEAFCDICNFPIVAVRWKCLNCADYDICSSCENLYLTLKRHNIYHIFAKLRFPLSSSIRNTESLHVPNLFTNEMEDETEQSDDEDHMLESRRLKNEAKVSCGMTIIHEGVFCSMCSHPIIGARYYCVHCQMECNLCEQCESLGSHSIDHVLIKINFSLPIPYNHPCFKLPLMYENVTTDEMPNRTGKIELVEEPPEQFHRNVQTTHSSNSLPANLRPFKYKDDISTIIRIEHESFFSPYCESFFYRFMKCPGHIIYVAQREDKKIGGYIACAAKKSVLEVVSLAVGMQSRRRGLAQQLLKAGLCFGKLSKCYKATLHVSVVNFPAQKLYTSFGFFTVGWENNYYKDENEGALLMEYIYY